MAEAGAIQSISTAGVHSIARVGPNAINRIREALVASHGQDTTDAVFAAAGLSGWLYRPPEAMVQEADVAALHRAMLAALGGPESRAVAAGAGRRTASYLLENRIPRPIAFLLTVMPPRLAARGLLRIISRHSWTFCGSGTFLAEADGTVTITITGGPLRASGPAAPAVAAYYAATFETLFRALVHPRTTVAALKRASEATAACAFSLTW